MKKLVIIRHAKSSWDDMSLADFDRPLNARGRRDAPVMAARLAKAVRQPDVFLTSPANRARTTAHMLAEGMGYPIEQIREDKSLYHASAGGILKAIRSLDGAAETVFVVGHNPGMTVLVSELTGTYLDNLPTCGIFGITANISAWQDLNLGEGKSWFYDYPKKNA